MSQFVANSVILWALICVPVMLIFQAFGMLWLVFYAAIAVVVPIYLFCAKKLGFWPLVDAKDNYENL